MDNEEVTDPESGNRAHTGSRHSDKILSCLSHLKTIHNDFAWFQQPS